MKDKGTSVEVHITLQWSDVEKLMQMISKDEIASNYFNSVGEFFDNEGVDGVIRRCIRQHWISLCQK